MKLCLACGHRSETLDKKCPKCKRQYGSHECRPMVGGFYQDTYGDNGSEGNRCMPIPMSDDLID